MKLETILVMDVPPIQAKTNRNLYDYIQYSYNFTARLPRLQQGLSRMTWAKQIIQWTYVKSQ